MVAHSLGLLPHRQPASLFPEPEMADSSPWSRTSWSCSLLARRHPCSSSLSQRWPIPVHGRPLAAASNPSPAGISLRAAGHGQLLPAVTYSLGLLPALKPAFLFPDPEMSTSCPRSRTRCGFSLCASRHRSFPPRDGYLLCIVAHSLGLLPHRQPESLLPLPEMAHSCPRSRPCWGCSVLASRQPSCLSQRWLPPVRRHALAGAVLCSQAAIPVPLPHLANSCPRSCTRWGCSPFAIRHPASLIPTSQSGTRGHALSGAAPCSQASIPLP